MHFLTLDQAQSEPFQSEYGYRIVTTLAALLICLAIAIAAGYGAYRAWVENTMFGVAILVWIAFWFGLFALILRGVLRARLRPTNWLVRTQTGGILVNLRSYLNYEFDPNNRAAVHFKYADIEFARAHWIRQGMPTDKGGGESIRFHRYAEFKLRNEALVKELKTELAEERTLFAPLGGRFIKGRKRSSHYPVHVSREGWVRIEWAVRPSLKKFLEEISGQVAFKEAAVTHQSFRAAQDQEALLLELIATGDRVGAIKVIKEIYGYDTTRAVKFLEEQEKSQAD